VIVGKIDVKKIEKAQLYIGKTSTYLDIALIPNKSGRDKYGNDGMIVQSVSKQARQEGIRGPILGNYVDMDYKQPEQEQKPLVTGKEPLGPEDDIPF
jgi:hypothetical protein